MVLCAMGQDLGPKLEKQPLSADTPWATPVIDDSDFNQQMLQVAKLISISKNEEFVEVWHAMLVHCTCMYINVIMIIYPVCLSVCTFVAIRLYYHNAPVRHPQRLSIAGQSKI